MTDLVEYKITNKEIVETGTVLTFSGTEDEVLVKLSYTLNLKKKTECKMGASGRTILCGDRAYVIRRP